MAIRRRTKGRMVADVESFLGIHPTAATGVLSSYGNQNEQDCKIYKHGRVSKSYRVRTSYILQGGALSRYLPPSRWQFGAAQRSCSGSFSFYISVIAQKTSLYIAPTQTRDIVWCTGLTQPLYNNAIYALFQIGRASCATTG